MRNILCVALLLLIVSCNKEFKAEKVDEYYNCIGKEGGELYLVKNYPKEMNSRDKFFFDFTKKNMANLCEIDSCVEGYAIAFYNDCSCTSGYFKRKGDNGMESLYERCQDDYLGGFLYERSKDNPKVWILNDSDEFCDTIFCE